jgi:hypothetical protein
VTVADLTDNLEHPLRGPWAAENRRRVVENSYIDEQRRRVEACAWDMLRFGRTYLPHHFTDETPDFHPQLVDLIMNLDPWEWFATEPNPDYDETRPTEPVYHPEAPPEHHNIIDFVNHPLRKKRDKQTRKEVVRRSIVVAAPRGHAKSTLLTLLIPLYCACYRLRRFIVIVSDTDDQVRRFCETIRSEIEENEDIRRDFGDLSGKRYGRSWTGSNFTICHTDVDRRGRRGVIFEMHISGRSAGSRVRGIKFKQHRPDLIICDDIENDVNTASELMRKALYDKVMSVYGPALNPHDGILLFCGTIIHFDSVLARLLDDPDLADTCVRRRWAATVGSVDVMDDNAVPIWPWRFNLEALRLERKRLGSAKFNKEYMNDPRDPESRDFQPHWIRWYHLSDLRQDRHGRIFWKHPEDPTDEELAQMPFGVGHGKTSWQELHIHQAVDPAISQRQRADLFTMGAGGCSKRTEDVIFLWLVRERMDFAAQLRTIEAMVNTYPRSRSVALDATAYQDALRQATRERFRRRYGRTRVPLKPLRQKNGLQTKEVRLRRRAIEIEAGCLWLRCLRPGDEGYDAAPWDETGTIKIHPNHFPLYQEMMQFPNGAHDDCLDCLDMLLSVMHRTRFFEEFAERERRANGGNEFPTTRTVGPRAVRRPEDNWIDISEGDIVEAA